MMRQPWLDPETYRQQKHAQEVERTIRILNMLTGLYQEIGRLTVTQITDTARAQIMVAHKNMHEHLDYLNAPSSMANAMDAYYLPPGSSNPLLIE